MQHRTGSGTVDYETIRQAMNGEPFTMSLTDGTKSKPSSKRSMRESTPILRLAIARIGATDMKAENERQGSWFCVGPWNVPSARNPCPFFFVACANRNLAAIPMCRLREISLPATSYVLGINEYGELVGREMLV